MLRIGRYLIIGCRRSGTTVIHLLLKGHPQVAALNDELTLSPLFTHGLRAFTVGEHFTPTELETGRRRLFDAVTGANATADTRLIGGKTVCGDWKSAHMLTEAIRRDLPDLKIILVNRSDLVAQFGSQLQHRQSGIAHSWSPGAGNRTATKTRIDRLLFRSYVINVLKTLDELRVLGRSHPFLEISYEKFSVDNDSIYHEAIEFLELPYVEPTWLDSKKVMPNPEDYIANYAEMNALMDELIEAFRADRLPPVTGFVSKVYKRLYDLFLLRYSARRRDH